MKHRPHRSARALRTASGRGSAACGGLESLESRCLLATFTVTTLDDSGAGSLRQAITEANNAAGADVIEFADGVSGQITLTSGELGVSDELTIEGPGAGVLAVSGNDASRVFVIGPVAATISGLTLTNGRATPAFGGDGGAIFIGGALTLIDSVVSDSFALGSGATPGRGGGIFNQGTLTLISSTVSGNTVAGGEDYYTGPRGGGVFNAGTMTITASTVSGNRASSGFEVGGRGGGIFNSGTLTTNNSTVSGNRAFTGERVGSRGGGIANEGALTLINTTVSGNLGSGGAGQLINGGGIYSEGTLTVHNSTIASHTGEDLSIESGTATLFSTIVEDLDGTLDPASSNNLIGDAPGLLPLADNGGPTFTHALLEGSAAIGAGINPLTLTTDQRGGLFDRSGNGGIDIGAFQTQTPPASLVVSTLSDDNDGDYSDGEFSLREAIELANGATGPDTITFAPPLGGTISLGGRELVLATDVSLMGPGSGLLSISGGNLSRVIMVNTGVTATIDALAIVQGLAGGNEGSIGGGILNMGALTLSNAAVSGNTANEGGGIRNLGTLALVNSSVTGNASLGGAGGGIRSSGTLTLTGSTVTGNSATGGAYARGGGIYASGSITLTGSTVSGNTAHGAGGGIRSTGTLTLTDSTITSNTSQLEGGGVAANRATLTGSIVMGNTALGDGGGILASGKLTISGSTLADNSSGNDGGGIYASGTLTLSDSTLSGNSAVGDGGGVLSLAATTISDSTIADNAAGGTGGGVFCAGELDMAVSTVSGNDADVNGGGIFAGELTLTSSTISGNRTEVHGGGIFASGTITSSTISGNFAKENGGGVYGNGAINNSTITDNEAQTLGGGVHTTGTIRLRSTIVAGNAGFDVSGTVAAGSTNNLVQDATVALGLVHGVSGNILGVDPLLEPLADNGGPTRTHALPAGSPALGGGSNPLNLTTDQRGDGFARVVAGRIDIGAFQRQTLDATSIALFGGGNFGAPIEHEAKAKRSNGTGFGPVERDNDSKSITYKITNDSGEVLVISRIEVRGQHTGDFTITMPPTLSIAPGASSEFTVTFDPTAFGNRRANIAIFSNDPDRPRFTMRIAGRGMPDPSQADIAVTGGAADIRDNDAKARPGTGQRFGPVNLGGEVIRIFTITNAGQSILSFLSPTIQISGLNAADFSIVAMPGAQSLAPGDSTTFSIRFLPSALGIRKATIAILSDDPDEAEFNFRVTGVGA